MNGQLWLSRNRHHPSPDLGLPALLPSQGGELRDPGANKTRSTGLDPSGKKGCCPLIQERSRSRSQSRTPPPPGPGRGQQAPARGCARTFPPPGPRGQRPEPPGGPCPDFTSFFTFHSSFSLTASSALPMVRRVASRLCRAAPQAPRCPRRLRASAQRHTRKAEPPPTAVPARRRRRSHCPVLGSAAIFRTPHRRQAPGPAPSHSRERGVHSAKGGSGRGQAARAWGRPARERATRAAVMATRRLQSRGREPAL